MLICPSDIFSSTNVMLLGQVFFSAYQLSCWRNLLFKPESAILQIKKKNVSIQHNSILTLMKSGTPFFRINIMYMIYLDVKYFSVVCLRICYAKLAVKMTFTTMGYFFAETLNYCPSSDIIWNSIALKC